MSLASRIPLPSGRCTGALLRPSRFCVRTNLAARLLLHAYRFRLRTRSGTLHDLRPRLLDLALRRTFCPVSRRAGRLWRPIHHGCGGRTSRPLFQDRARSGLVPSVVSRRSLRRGLRPGCLARTAWIVKARVPHWRTGHVVSRSDGARDGRAFVCHGLGWPIPRSVSGPGVGITTLLGSRQLWLPRVVESRVPDRRMRYVMNWPSRLLNGRLSCAWPRGSGGHWPVPGRPVLWFGDDLLVRGR
jgi:hypothetical protein